VKSEIRAQGITDDGSLITHYPKVSVIVLNWNGLDDTVECLESLKKIAYANCEIIVVDNGSRGNDADILEERFGDYIHMIRNDKNYGYTGGNNIGIKYAIDGSKPDYVLVLNNDTVVAPDFLNRMIEIAEGDASIGVVGPKVCHRSNPDRIQSIGAKVNMWTGQASPIGVNEVDAGQYDDAVREVDYVSGCCMLVRTEVIQKVGLFDESFFCYWDETDYCLRTREAGCRVVCVPQARILHKTPGKVSGLPYYYMARNNFRFMRKHATRGQYRTFLFYYLGYHFWLMTGACLLYHHDVGRLVGLYRGVRDGLLDSDSGARFYARD
jgi:GT2 family glycosyltransferase